MDYISLCKSSAFSFLRVGSFLGNTRSESLPKSTTSFLRGLPRVFLSFTFLSLFSFFGLPLFLRCFNHFHFIINIYLVILVTILRRIYLFNSHYVTQLIFMKTKLFFLKSLNCYITALDHQVHRTCASVDSILLPACSSVVELLCFCII